MVENLDSSDIVDRDLLNGKNMLMKMEIFYKPQALTHLV